MHQHDLRHHEASLGELFGELTRSSRKLIRQEVHLARLELKDSLRRAGKGATQLGAGLALALAALLALSASAIALLAGLMPVWLAALIVAAVAGLFSYLIIRRGLAALQAAGEVPAETVETVREDVIWLKKRT